MSMKLNEQIAFLRKEKGATQDELATVLGVSNQAVSKWEAGICCPDIALLPEIAKYFEVSIDELMGYKGADPSKDIILQFKNMIDGMEKSEDYRFALKMAYVLHAIVFSKCMERENKHWDSEGSIEHAGKAEWGYSCVNLPEITSVMRRESVFFSSNRNLRLDNLKMRNICALLKTFSSVKNLKTMLSIWELTVQDENVYVSVSQIAEKSGLSQMEVLSCVENEIFEYLSTKSDGDELCFRIDGARMDMVPLLAMLVFP